jgi:hypothetical protein
MYVTFVVRDICMCTVLGVKKNVSARDARRQGPKVTVAIEIFRSHFWPLWINLGLTKNPVFQFFQGLLRFYIVTTIFDVTKSKRVSHVDRHFILSTISIC